MTRTPRTESGFVLPTAIFLLVILAALAAYMVSLSRTSHISSALDVQGTRAYLAARAGIEWGAWQLLRNPVPSCVAVAPPLTGFGGTLAAFTVNVSCVPSGTYTDGANTVTVYQITSTATSGKPGEVDYVERQVQASFSK
jgi:MSHA biogenesis protein MshP